MAPLAFVTGATGTVGPYLIDTLLTRGYRVRALVRSPDAYEVPKGVEVIAGGLHDEASVRRGVEGANVVFHLAALLHINDPRPEVQAQYQVVNVEGTRILVEAAKQAAVGRFVFFSTISVYGPSSGGKAWEETDALAPVTLYGQSKKEAESVVRSVMPSSTILRLAAVYGPQMKGNYPTLAGVLGKGIRFFVGNGRNRRTLVHTADVAQASILAAEHPGAVGETFNVTDGAVHRFDDIARAMQQAMGRRPGITYVPASIVRPMLTVAQTLLKAINVRFSGPLLLDKLIEDVAVSGDKLREELGFEPHYALTDGWRNTLGARSS